MNNQEKCCTAYCSYYYVVLSIWPGTCQSCSGYSVVHIAREPCCWVSSFQKLLWVSLIAFWRVLHQGNCLLQNLSTAMPVRPCFGMKENSPVMRTLIDQTASYHQCQLSQTLNDLVLSYGNIVVQFWPSLCCVIYALVSQRVATTQLWLDCYICSNAHGLPKTHREQEYCWLQNQELNWEWVVSNNWGSATVIKVCLHA